jgi:hypothetical protein
LGRQRTSLKEKLEGGYVKGAADECWLWMKPLRCWYGGIWCGERQRTISTHRASYEVYVGPIPDGLCVLHRCDVPRCVNPRHLFLGTQSDNIADRHAKGRTVVIRLTGSNAPHAKLTEGDVAEIRKLRSAGYTLQRLGEMYGIEPSGICMMCTGKTWKSAPGPITPKKTHEEINQVRAVLREELIPQIREKHSLGVKTSKIATDFGVAPRTIRDIINGLTWKHVA